MPATTTQQRGQQTVSSISNNNNKHCYSNKLCTANFATQLTEPFECRSTRLRTDLPLTACFLFVACFFFLLLSLSCKSAFLFLLSASFLPLACAKVALSLRPSNSKYHKRFFFLCRLERLSIDSSGKYSLPAFA